MALIWLCVSVVDIFLIGWLFRRLESRHTTVWDEIGRPRIISNHSLGVAWRGMLFRYSSRWRRLDDAALGRVIVSTRVLDLAAAGIFVGVLYYGAFG
jgi:hypothetical protein